jgi:cell division protein FtsQ
MSAATPRVNTDPRISRRRKAVARSKRRRYFIGAALILGVFTAVYVMFWSPLLAVDEVRVLGARHTTSQEIAAVAGLDAGDNLLRLSTSAIAEAAEELPWIKKAEVDRMLPGTVRVRVIEREPALVLSLDSGQWTIDGKGMVLAEGEPSKDLPVLAGVEVGGVAPGDHLQTEESIDALKAFRSLPASMKEDVALILAPTRERISFSVRMGAVVTNVRFGAAERMKEKNEVLRALLRRLRSEAGIPAYIDVRVPTNPAVSLTPAVGQDTPTAVPTVGATPTVSTIATPEPTPAD